MSNARDTAKNLKTGLNVAAAGSIIDVQKAGTTVGQISNLGNDFVVGSPTGSGAGLRFDGTNNMMYASNSLGNARDDAVSLGASSVRFKNLYLSGGVYLGGTGSSNHLEDYEEGTWTPTSPTVTLTGGPSGHYTKVGRMVIYTCTFQFPSSSSGVQAMIDGLPFSDNGTGAGSYIRYTNHGSYYTVTISGNRLYFYDLGGSATSIASVDPRRFDLAGVLMTA